MARTSTMAVRFGLRNDKSTWRRGLALWSTLAACAVLLVGPPASASAQQATNLMDTLGVSADLSTFTQMLETAGLGDTLRAPGALTVWAPVNAGFDKLPAATRTRLNSDPALLKTVLSYHLAPQPVTAAQIVQVPSVRTLEGESVRVQAAEGSVHLNDTTVLRPDVRASNGIIHVIDGVLLPPSISPVALPATGVAAVSELGGWLVLSGLLLVVAGGFMLAGRGRARRELHRQRS